ncbi:hypothetical protein OHA98_41070 [Streptomyces sp. NBC_00654]|uniref:hypothetical protein n=1 Tax=Streptomyces sp. NBC_00654 TaxID=2975799 RepID=UPI002252FCBE|nr:hypothetical protein [Streptomyces sp. NBC_00654]MCX4971008.1 hypothetical protein [Streptomyces sp. NBC_00654]
MSNFPAVGSDGENNGYKALRAKLTRLQNAADRLREEAEGVALRMKRNAKFAAVVADMCAAAEVDARHLTAIGGVSRAFGRCTAHGLRVAGAADRISQAAGRAKTVHQAQYGGIHAAVQATKARQAKPGFYRKR